ncbi:hypothetical protein ALP94_02846 [Pseudomonas savastanoi pv. glycinea]|jgi:hypothetical protein|nr:hypothetical protein [Pseudomonas syringae]MCQ2999127.1 hypothetical protein [Pseudomonas syringae]RMQ97918.1 hypothetical protein ALP94_02846 [Pseudomonas savastanoi pv. glycinea]
MTRVAAFLLTALFSQFALSAGSNVEGFLSDPLEVFDEQRNYLRDLPKKDAPTKPIPVLQYNEALDLVQVELAGQKVWLDNQDLRVNPPLNGVDLPCQKLQPGKSTDSQNNSTMGYGAGCNKP